MSEPAPPIDDKALLAVLGRYVSPTRAQSILVRARLAARDLCQALSLKHI